MSTLTLDPSRGTEDSGAAARRTLLFAIAIQLALLAPSLIALGLDDRLLNGISVWSKPVKFQLSLVLLYGTLLLLLPLAAPTRGLARASLVIAATGTFEIAYITLQAARGRASHFNDATPLEATMYSAMGAVVTVLVLAVAWIGVAIWRTRPRAGAAGLHLGAALGLVLGALLTLVTAFVLAGNGGHWVGGTPSDVGALPLFGWSRTGGDLRVPHFFATHIMQALPVLGLVADRIAPRRATALVWTGAAVAAVVVAATFAQAMAGRPFL